MFRFEDLQIWLRAAESLCLGLGAWGLVESQVLGAWSNRRGLVLGWQSL